ncbi:hypothetical protein JHK84_042943 [Glycine max]|nr:hypothetical protein JHK84_042943 [Glycine max]
MVSTPWAHIFINDFLLLHMLPNRNNISTRPPGKAFDLGTASISHRFFHLTNDVELDSACLSEFLFIVKFPWGVYFQQIRFGIFLVGRGKV